jgi:hypothetical protein
VVSGAITFYFDRYNHPNRNITFYFDRYNHPNRNITIFWRVAFFGVTVQFAACPSSWFLEQSPSALIGIIILTATLPSTLIGIIILTATLPYFGV